MVYDACGIEHDVHSKVVCEVGSVLTSVLLLDKWMAVTQATVKGCTKMCPSPLVLRSSKIHATTDGDTSWATSFPCAHKCKRRQAIYTILSAIVLHTVVASTSVGRRPKSFMRTYTPRNTRNGGVTRSLLIYIPGMSFGEILSTSQLSCTRKFICKNRKANPPKSSKWPMIRFYLLLQQH